MYRTWVVSSLRFHWLSTHLQEMTMSMRLNFVSLTSILFLIPSYNIQAWHQWCMLWLITFTCTVSKLNLASYSLLVIELNHCKNLFLALLWTSTIPTCIFNTCYYRPSDKVLHSFLMKEHSGWSKLKPLKNFTIDQSSENNWTLDS